jgi:NADH-quinone oxidoreductase subunit C
MDENLLQAVEALAERFGASHEEFRGEITVFLRPDQIADACQLLRDEFGFNMLSELTAVDYWPQQEPRFNVFYQLISLSEHTRLGLRVPIPGIRPLVPTIEKVFPNANWYERELWDMFGIRVDGHSDLRRILMPYDWEGHPLRKDFPLGYEEVQFTFNAREIDQDKSHPKE